MKRLGLVLLIVAFIVSFISLPAFGRDGSIDGGFCKPKPPSHPQPTHNPKSVPPKPKPEPKPGPVISNSSSSNSESSSHSSSSSSSSSSSTSSSTSSATGGDATSAVGDVKATVGDVKANGGAGGDGGNSKAIINNISAPNLIGQQFPQFRNMMDVTTETEMKMISAAVGYIPPVITSGIIQKNKKARLSLNPFNWPNGIPLVRFISRGPATNWSLEEFWYQDSIGDTIPDKMIFLRGERDYFVTLEDLLTAGYKPVYGMELAGAAGIDLKSLVWTGFEKIQKAGRTPYTALIAARVNTESWSDGKSGGITVNVSKANGSVGGGSIGEGGSTSGEKRQFRLYAVGCVELKEGETGYTIVSPKIKPELSTPTPPAPIIPAPAPVPTPITPPAPMPVPEVKKETPAPVEMDELKERALKARKEFDETQGKASKAVEDFEQKVNLAKDRLKEIERITGGPVVVRRAPRLPQYTIQFKFDSDEILPSEYPKIMEFARQLKKSGFTAQTEGHASREGSEAYNADLSLRRSKAVYKMFIEYGVPEWQIQFVGLGKSRPTGNPDISKDRRVNVRFIDGVSGK